MKTTLKQKSGWIYFVCNTIIVLFTMLRRINSFIEFIFLALGIIALWFILVKKAEEKSVNAVDRVPVILFFDSMIFFAVNMNQWRYALGRPGFVGSGMTAVAIVFAIIGIILYVLGVKKSKPVFSVFAYEAWFFSIMALLGWNPASWFNNTYLRLFFILYLLGNVTWWFVVRLACLQNYNRVKTTTILGLGIFGKIFFLIGFAPQYTVSVLGGFHTICQEYAETILRPRNLIILVIAVIVLAIYFSNESFTGRQLKGSIMIAGTICVVKACIVFFVPGGFLAIFVYLAVMVKDLKKTGYNNATVHNDDDSIPKMLFPLFLSTAIIAALFLISIGMWLLVILGIVLFAILMKQKSPEKRPVLIIVFSTIMAFAALYLYKWNPKDVAAVAIVMVGLLILLRFASQKHPSVDLKNTGWKAFLCCASVLLMTLFVVQNGTNLRVEADVNAGQIYMTAEEKNDDAHITEAYSYSGTDGALSIVAAGAFDSGSSYNYDYMSNDGRTASSAKGFQSGINTALVVTRGDDGTCTISKRYVPVFFSQFNVPTGFGN